MDMKSDFRRDDIPVEVISREGREVFANLAEAQAKHPALDIHKPSTGFTWAMCGRDPKTGAVMARFETTEVFNLLSMD